MVKGVTMATLHASTCFTWLGNTPSDCQHCRLCSETLNIACMVGSPGSAWQPAIGFGCFYDMVHWQSFLTNLLIWAPVFQPKVHKLLKKFKSLFRWNVPVSEIKIWKRTQLQINHSIYTLDIHQISVNNFAARKIIDGFSNPVHKSIKKGISKKPKRDLISAISGEIICGYSRAS